MDIRRWLEETKTPGPPASLGLPAGQHARECTPRDAAKRPSHPQSKRKRPQRPSSPDSSLLQLDRTNGHHHSVTQSTGNGDRARQHTASDKAASRCSSELSGSADRSESELYVRRPRRKTRPEIYEPKADKNQNRPNRGRRKDRHAPTRHKDRRQPRHRQRDPGHAFHAKNVAKDRLTLKPKEGLGLFKKGRASSPVKGRGLPDLVFSEMRFLQKRSDPRDGQSAEEPSKIRRKSGNAATQEDEISAYFAAKRPTLAEKSVNLPTTKRPGDPSRGNARKARCASLSSNNSTHVKPPVDLPEKPYLGFGTRGHLPSGSDTTYHIPWSESGRSTSAAASQRSLGRSLSLQMDVRRQHDDCDDTSSDSTGLIHPRMRCGNSDDAPLELANRRRFQSDSEPTDCDGAVFFQQKPQDRPHFRLDVTRTKSPVPPSPHKQWKDRNGRELTPTAPRPPSTRDEEDAPNTDVNKQQERRTNHARKGNQSQPASAGRADLRAAQSESVKMAQDAIQGTTDATRMRAPLRSLSPLGKLLRQCDNACHDPLPAQSAPVKVQSRHMDMGHVEKSVEIDYAASQAEAHRYSVSPRWAGGITPTRLEVYQMQVPGAAVFDNQQANYAAAEDVCMREIAGNAIDDEEGRYQDDLVGPYLARDRSEGYVDMGVDSAEDSHGGSLYSIGWEGGQDIGRKNDKAKFEGELAGFWRPHKLY